VKFGLDEGLVSKAPSPALKHWINIDELFVRRVIDEMKGS
jgi:hypothetical protein